VEIKIKKMENNKNKPPEGETSAKSVLEGGKQAIEADEKINRKEI